MSEGWKLAFSIAKEVGKLLFIVVMLVVTISAIIQKEWAMVASYLLMDIIYNDRLATRVTVNVNGDNVKGEANDPS